MSKKTNVVDDSLQEAVLKTRSTFGFAKLNDWGVFELKGPDAANFMQGRVTNDVLALEPGQGQRNASLDRQAKIEGVFTLLRLSEETFWLLAPQVEAENAIKGIEKYHITEQFKVQSLSNSVWTMQGPQSTQVLEQLLSSPLPTEPFSHVEVQLNGATMRIVKQSLTGETGYLLMAENSSLEAPLNELIQKQDGLALTPEALNALRIEAGLPWFGADYDTDTLLPETGLERETVNYSKGCYLGQETVARVKTYGAVQKALTGLLLEPNAKLPPENTPCLLNGKLVGQVKSVVFSPTLKRPIAMAYLGKSERIPGSQLALEIAGQTYQVTVALLPFYESPDLQKSGKVLLQEGLKLFSDGFDEEAIRVLKQATEVDSNLLEAYEALGVILSRYERYDEAIGLMNQILELDPDHVLAHTNLSVFYMKLGDKEKAEDEKAKATMAAFSKRAKEAGLVFDIEAERRKKEQAALERLAMFEEALKFNPEDPLGNFGLGSIYLELNRFTEAVAPFEKVIQVQPKHTVAYLSLGKAYEGIGQAEQAKTAYQKGIEVAAAKGDLMPLKEMQQRLERLS